MPDNLLEPGATRFKNITSAALLNHPWSAVADEAVRAENFVPFQWASWVLREDAEDDLSTEDLSSLRGEIESLEQTIAETDMSPYLRSFLLRQVDAIRSALRVYRIRGVGPIGEALHKVTGAYAMQKSQVEAEYVKASDPAKGLVERTVNFIKKTAEVADNLDKIKNFGQGAYTLASQVAPLLLSVGPHLLK
ncbi:hypothetical protein [Burkholderia cenocepacia]